MSKLAVELNNVEFCYSKQTSTSTLSIPDLKIEQGDRVFLSGSSGSGKTTLLRLLTGILKPQYGLIRLNNTNIVQLSAGKMDAFRARNIGLVSQQFNLLPYLSVQDNLRLAGYFAGTAVATVRERSVAFMQQLHLDTALLSRQVDALSTGQQQRVAICRALINQPEIVLADEPTSALDEIASGAFIDMLQATMGKDSTLIMVSHDQRLAKHFNRQIQFAELIKSAKEKA